MQANLAESLREVIRASGKSAGQLAAASTVDKGIITRFLRAERSITVDTADKLLAGLGCTVAIKGPTAGAPAMPLSPKRRGRKPTDKPTKGR
jgi:transcriptional regulator with XRE-family HTH domain